MTSFVSIVMSAYNAERTLSQALDSALAQTHPHREIIVVDDGSTDATAAILEDYRLRHGIRVFSQGNEGQSAALNRGFAESRGEYIKFFDSDDVISPDMIAIQVAALEDRPGCLAYGTWGRFYTRPEEARFTPHPGWHDGAPLEWILETWADTETMYQCALFLLPREILQRCGAWDSRLGLINDFEFFTRIILRSQGIVFTPDARLYYRSGLPATLSRQKSRKALASGTLSCQLATGYLLATEDSPRTRRVSADILQSFVFSFYPRCPDLAGEILREIDRLGGSSLRPGGGAIFRAACRLLGWRRALTLRERLRPRPA